MATYTPYARSSYAKVKDAQAFADYCDRYNLQMIERNDHAHGLLHGFLYMDDMGIQEEVEIGIEEDPDGEQKTVYAYPLKELADHLADGWAIEVREIGHEALRYLSANSAVVDYKGNIYWASLDHSVSTVIHGIPHPVTITEPIY